jgi:hypothetical protein
MSYSDFRLYTSIPFAKWCDANNITVVGTLNEMRKGVPADFKVDFFLLTLHPGCTTKRKQSFIVLMSGGGGGGRLYQINSTDYQFCFLFILPTF